MVDISFSKSDITPPILFLFKIIFMVLFQNFYLRENSLIRYFTSVEIPSLSENFSPDTLFSVPEERRLLYMHVAARAGSQGVATSGHGVKLERNREERREREKERAERGDEKENGETESAARETLERF